MPETESTNISKQIDEILKRRKEKAVTLRVKKQHIEELQSMLSDCDQFYDSTSEIEDEKIRKQCRQALGEIRVPDEIFSAVKEVLNRIKYGIARFERESINIATVGKARQGKSSFLQAVSGLDNDIIPAYNAGDCTGAVSIIHNDPSMAPGTVSAELTFRTEEEMLDIVKEYITGIMPNYFSEHTLTFDSLPKLRITKLKDDAEEAAKNGKAPGVSDATRSLLLGHLEKLIKAFKPGEKSIEELCGHPVMTLTDKDKIRTYVAQNNGKSVGEEGRDDYYNYLAVKKAEIYCRFPDDVGKLVMVDTIGLGDTQLGIEDSMLETVDKQSDAAVVITMPIAGVHTDDEHLYTMLEERFKTRDIGKWLFYLANHKVGHNDDVVATFVNDVTKNFSRIVTCKSINCIDQKSVREEFLIPMLKSLSESIDSIDNAYIAEIDAMCAKLKARLEKVIDELPQPDNMSSTAMLGVEVYKLGCECYSRLASDLLSQVREWYELRNEPNATLWNRVKDILDNLEGMIPSAETLQTVLEKNGTLMEAALWHTPLNYLRNEITDQFIAIDGLMERETLKFKNSIVRELYDSLKNLSGKMKSDDEDEEDEDKDKAQWLWEIMAPLLRNKPEYAQIYKAFQFINKFEFNVRAQLIQEVRHQLRIINPLTPEYYMNPNYTFSHANIGQSVHFYLTSRIAILEDSLRHSLATMNKMPNQAFYAAAEEFYDRLTFASDFKNGKFVDMSQVWGNFFTEFSQLLWAEEVNKHAVVEKIMKNYEEYCNKLKYQLTLLA